MDAGFFDFYCFDYGAFFYSSYLSYFFVAFLCLVPFDLFYAGTVFAGLSLGDWSYWSSLSAYSASGLLLFIIISFS